MKIRPARFNIYLLAALLAGWAGCETTRPARESSTKPAKKTSKKDLTILNLHLQVSPVGTDRAFEVAIYRRSPVKLTVNRTPFLTAANITEASVVDAQGVMAIRIQFDRQGALLLENVTTAYKNGWIAVFANFGEQRWLAAPFIERRLTDGVFTFTPDATREEAERVVAGLNNVAKKLKNAPPPPKKSK